MKKLTKQEIDKVYIGIGKGILFFIIVNILALPFLGLVNYQIGGMPLADLGFGVTIGLWGALLGWFLGWIHYVWEPKE
jgi:hypothetical protein